MSENLADTYTAAEAAAYLGVSLRTVRRYIAAGTLPVVRRGPRSLFIRRADLDALVRVEVR